MNSRLARHPWTKTTASSLRSGLRREACEDWRVAPPLAEALFLLPLAGTLVFLATRLHWEFFVFLTREDGPLEWLQVLGFVVAAVFALLATWLLRRRNTVVVGLYGLFAVGCIFFAGEEISWGQRLFGLETPGGLREVNAQDELTVHNILAVRTALKLLVLAFGVYAVVGAPVIRRLAQRQPNELARLLAPPLFLTSSFAVVVAYNLARLIDSPSTYLLTYGGTELLVKTSEWAEFCLAFGIAGFAVLSWRRLRRPPAAPD